MARAATRELKDRAESWSELWSSEDSQGQKHAQRGQPTGPMPLQAYEALFVAYATMHGEGDH